MAGLNPRKVHCLRVGLACFFAVLTLGGGWAGRGEATELSLPEAWQYALRHSTAALEAKIERRKGERERAEARTRLLPRLEFVGGPVLNNYAESDNYWVTNLNLRNPEKDFNQQLFRLSNSNIYQRIGELISESLLENLKLELIKGYCQYHFLLLKRNLLEELVQSGNSLELYLEGMPRSSLTDLKLLLELRQGLSSDQAQLKDTQIELLTLQSNLKRIIGLPYPESFSPGGNLAELVSGLSEKTLEPPRPGSNLDLQLLQEKLKLASSKTKFDQLRKYPEPVFGIDLGWGPILRPRGALLEDVDGFKYQVFLGLKWNLWDWGRTQAEIDESMDHRNLLKKRTEAFLENMEHDWQLIQAKIAIFKKRAADQEEFLNQVQEYVRWAHQEYLDGRGSFRAYFELCRQSGDLKLKINELRKSILLFQIEVSHLFGGLDIYRLFN